MNGDKAKGTTLREYLYVNGLQIVFTDDSNTQEEDTCSIHIFILDRRKGSRVKLRQLCSRLTMTYRLMHRLH
jgi:hypothetical protein